MATPENDSPLSSSEAESAFVPSKPPTDSSQPSQLSKTPISNPDATSISNNNNVSSALSDPLAAIGSMWTGWMSTASVPDGPDMPDTATPEERDQMASAATTANEWLEGAGRVWESAVKDVGSKLKSAAEGVDTSALEEQVDVIRKRSGRFVEDVSKSVQNINLSLDQAELQKRAEVISSSTRNLLDKASQSLSQGRQEAMEIFVDADPNSTSSGSAGRGGNISVSPWDRAALPQSEHKYADSLRQEMLKIVVDSIYSKKKRTDLFLSGVAESNKFEFDFNSKSGMAMAALESDKNMRRLRAGLVPGKMKEDLFWTTYFYHVHRVRQTLVANQGVMPEISTEDDEDAAALFAEDDEDEELAALDSPLSRPAAPTVKMGSNDTQKTKASGDGQRNWEDEIDAAFDDDE